MAFKLSKDDKQSLLRFLERRNLKERVIECFAHIIEQKNLKRGDLTQDKNATYAILTDGLEKAISKGWMTEQELISLLDDSEVAGRQHVCIYEVPAASITDTLSAIRQPTALQNGVASVGDFWDLPSASYARVLRDTSSEALVKIVSRRRYWRSEIDSSRSNADEEWIHRWIEEERSAVVIKCSKSTRILQIRVPPRERSPQAETGKSIHDFAIQLLGTHYSIGKGSWLSKVKLFSITDAFNKILENKQDFVLRHDTPESDTAKSRLSKKGSIKELKDLRDDEMWTFGNGYARKTLRGTWVVKKKPIYSHLNLDKLKTAKGGSIEFARVFFPHFATDSEVDHVIQRIRDHF